MEVTYENLIKHLNRECLMVMVTCPLVGCTAQFYRGAWEDHYRQVCDGIVVSCPQCEESNIPKKNMDQHNCVRSLRAKMEVQEGRISKQEE